jgi:hypothetical protein
MIVAFPGNEFKGEVAPALASSSKTERSGSLIWLS